MANEVVDLKGNPIEAPVFKDISGEAEDICEFAADLFNFIMSRSPSQASLMEIIGAIEVIKHDIQEFYNEA